MWVGPTPGTFIEVKYHRPIPSGKNKPVTQHYGDLLADVNKLCRLDGIGDRLLVLAADKTSSDYLKYTAAGFLPGAVGRSTVVPTSKIKNLPKSALAKATVPGEWSGDVPVELIWFRRIDQWTLYCWVVEPAV
jgi:hypothetical protein